MKAGVKPVTSFSSLRVRPRYFIFFGYIGIIVSEFTSFLFIVKVHLYICEGL